MSTDTRILQTKEDAKRKSEEKANQTGITFFNINSGETRVAGTGEHIASFFNSSDLGPNAHNRQDFGWRLAPEIVVEMEQVKEDPTLMSQIAATYQIPPDEVADFNVLKFIADRKFKAVARTNAAQGKNYASEYEKNVAAAREQAAGTPEEVAETPAKADNSNVKAN